ncbi:MAG: Ferredoxin [Parcubacteria group bacterium ADurb.Bin247]|jgi:ferredoxin|nr:MAG: Ferredoxin [Parcubacteria group bacterium ADurb.Bin247]HQB84828.1 ferredoxin [Candidatus Pacearchaeota archaeon]
MKKIIHDRDACVGCGLCASVCPEYWTMSEDGKATLNSSALELEELGCMQDAVDSCPVQCISILENN